MKSPFKTDQVDSFCVTFMLKWADSDMISLEVNGYFTPDLAHNLLRRILTRILSLFVYIRVAHGKSNSIAINYCTNRR